MKKQLCILIVLVLGSVLLFASEYVENKEVDIPGLMISNDRDWIDMQDELTAFKMPSYSRSSLVSDSIQVEFDDVIMDFHLDTLYTAYKKLDGSTDGYQNSPAGIVIDPEGKIWVGFQLGNTREFERAPGDVINLRGLHCFMPNGDPAPFSPIEFLEFDDGTKDTLYAESEYNGSARGLTMMDNGNILYTAWSTIYKINYKTGEGIAMWYPPKDGFPAASMTEPAYDPVEDLVYVGHVNMGTPIYMLDEDLLYIGKAVEECSHLHRSIVVRTKSDGISQLFSGSVWNGHGIFVYESADPLFEPYQLVDTIANEIVVSDTQTISYMAWPSCMDWYDQDEGILLYGNYMNAKVYVDQGTVPEAKHASQWVFLDVDNDCQLGVFGDQLTNYHLMPIGEPPYSLNFPDGTLSPRGASFQGNSIYTVDYDLNMIQKWTITSADEPVLMNIIVSDSADSAILTYGWAPTATDGFDAEFDEYDSLLAPSGSFDAHFGNDLIADVREPNYSDSINWILNYQAGTGNGPIVIEWDSTAFPEYGEFALKNTFLDSLIYIDMRESSSFVVPDSGLPFLTIIFDYDMSADFDAEQVNGKAPMAVKFKDRSKGNIRSWFWDFGDGQTSREKNPIHVYKKTGIYDVNLTVQDYVNQDVIQKSGYITVNYPDNPVIVGVEDVPNDQGGWVTLDFSRSYYDTDTVGVVDSLSDGMEMYTLEISSNETDWIASNSTIAYGDDHYSVLVHTLDDSSASTQGLYSFRVVAGMAEGNFISNVFHSYSVDNIAPPAPTNLLAGNSSTGVRIEWTGSEANDVKHYRVYKCMNEDFDESTLLGETSTNDFIDDSAVDNDWYYYRVSAVDQHDNEGPAGEILAVEVGLAEQDLIPDNYELIQNYPNPFNPVTNIEYALPKVSDVEFTIYNIAGSKIKEWHFNDQAAGWYQLIWDGTNMNNKIVSSGIYLYSIKTDEYYCTRKMMFLK